jgi:hypothetical protein
MAHALRASIDRASAISSNQLASRSLLKTLWLLTTCFFFAREITQLQPTVVEETCRTLRSDVPLRERC